MTTFVLTSKTKSEFKEELEKMFGLHFYDIESLGDHKYKVSMVGNFCSLNIILEHGEDESQWEEPKRDGKLVYGSPNKSKISKGEWRIPMVGSETLIQLASLYQVDDVKNLIDNLETARRIKRRK